MTQWKTPDGKARVSILPKAEPEDNARHARLCRAVLAVEPDATEGPVAMLEAGEIVRHAFIEAGAWALLSITVLLLVVLRRVSDVVLTLFPLALAGLVTMELWRCSECRSISPTSLLCRYCSASASRSRSTTSSPGATARPTCCRRR